MSVFHVREALGLAGPAGLAEPEGVMRRLRARRLARRERRDFEALFHAWAHGSPLPKRLRRGSSPS